MSVSRAPATGWFLEVDISESDTRRLRPAGEPEWSPIVNDLPEIDIPVRDADNIWTSGRADGATVRVFKDGVRLPFEEIAAVNQRRGDGRSEVILTCVGGTDLNKRVRRTYQNQPASAAVRTLIRDETSLIANVDDPGGNNSTVTLVSADSGSALDSELQTALPDADLGDSTVPLTVNQSANRIERERTSWLWVADSDFSLNTGTSGVPDPGAEQDTAVELTGSFNGFTVPSETAGYDIPQGEVGVAVHARVTGAIPSGETASLQIAVSGSNDFLPIQSLSQSYQWVSLDHEFAAVSGGSVSGGAELRNPDNPPAIRISGFVIYDARAEPDTFDDSPDPFFKGPGPYDGAGPATQLETGERLSPATLAGATTEVTLAAGDPADTLQVTARTRAGEATETGETTATVEPGATSDRASGAVTLSGSGTQSGQSPTTGVVAQDLDSLTLTGLSTGERRLIGESFDDDLVNILQSIAEQTGAVWAVEPAAAGGTSLEWTRPGLRDAQGTISASAVDVDRISQRVEAATVRGGRRQRATEFTAPDPNSGTPSAAAAVGGGTVGRVILGASPGDSATTKTLQHDTIIPGTERVVRTSDSTEFEPVTDYELDYLRGVFELVTTGGIAAGDQLRIEYQHKPTGRYESGQWDGDPVADQVFDIGRATTPDAAQQAAQRIVRETPSARIEARVDLSGLDPTTSVVQALGVDALDIDRAFTVRGFDDTPGDATLRLGTARPVEEIVARIASDIGDVDQRI